MCSTPLPPKISNSFVHPDDTNSQPEDPLLSSQVDPLATQCPTQLQEASCSSLSNPNSSYSSQQNSSSLLSSEDQSYEREDETPATPAHATNPASPIRGEKEKKRGETTRGAAPASPIRGEKEKNPNEVNEVDALKVT